VAEKTARPAASAKPAKSAKGASPPVDAARTATKTSARVKAPARTAATRAAKAPAKAAAARPAAVAPRAAVKRAVPRKRAAAPAAGVAAAEQFTWRRLRRKTKLGVVVSAKMAKTLIVEVGRLREHPLYKKVLRTRKRFATHDPNGEARAGDLVRIQESRPYSATKRWRLVEVISRAGEAGAAAPLAAEVEKLLEEAEGVSEILVPVRPDDEAAASEGQGER